MTRGSRRPRHDEEGSALVLALVFITVIGLWLSAVLGFAETGFRASRVVSEQRDLLYAADGAMDAVIQKVRTEKTCSDIYSAPPINDIAVKVDCQPPLKPNAHDQFANPARALETGEVPQPLLAEAALTTGAAQSASITLAGYGPPAPMGPVTALALRVSHRETGDVKKLTAEVTVTTALGPRTIEISSDASQCRLCIRTELTEDTITLDDPDLVGVTLVGVTVRYSAQLADGGGRRATESLDGILLDVTAGSQAVTLKPTVHDQFENPTSAFQIESPQPAPPVATATLASSGPTSASILLSGYSRLTIPPEAVIEEATLRISHAEAPAAEVQSVTVTVTPAPGTGDAVPIAVAPKADMTEDRVDLGALDLDEPAQYRSLTVRYEVTLAPGAGRSAVAQLDGIWIEISYAPEGFPRADPGTKPERAILALGQSAPAEDGIRQAAGTTSVVRGGVGSRSTVEVEESGSLVVQEGDIVAAGGCSATITCTTDDPGEDPLYAPAITELPPRRTVPTECPGWIVTLEPGYYDDAVALSKLTTAGGPCAAKVVRFEAGAYYFNFGFDAPPDSGDPSCQACTWTIADPNVHVIGGEPRRWDPGAGSRPDPLPFPGGCDPDQDGVQFVFGGNSRLHVTGGKMELCPPASTAAQPQRIAIYGLKDTSPVPDGATLDPTAHDQFENPGNAFEIDEPGSTRTANVRLSSGAATRASIRLHGLGANLLPAGVVRATLRVSHAEPGDVASLRATVTTASGKTVVVDAAPAPCNPETSLCVHQELRTDRVDLDLAANQLTDPNEFRSVKVRLEVTLASGTAKQATHQLDGVALDVQQGTALLPVTTTLRPTGHDQFVAGANALKIDGANVAEASLSTASPTASISLSGFDQVTVPPDATVEELTLKVAHRHSGPTSSNMVTVTPGDGSASVSSVVGQAVGEAPVVHDVDLKALGIGTPQAVSGLRVGYTVILPPAASTGVTAALDGMQLVVVYRLPVADTARLTSTGHDQFTSPASAFRIEPAGTAAQSADVALGSGRAEKAAITLTGFGPTLPRGDAIRQVTLRVSHRDGGDVAALKVVVTPPGGGSPITIDQGGQPCNREAGLCIHPDLAEDQVDLSALGLTVSPEQLSGVKVRYEVTLAAGDAKSATEALDGISLRVQHGASAQTDLEPAVHDQFVNPANAAQIEFPVGAQTADATLSTAGATSASMTMTGYNQLALPPEAVIDSVTLRLAHGESTPDAVDRLEVTVTYPAGGSRSSIEINSAGPSSPACNPPASLAVQGTLTEDRIDLKACGLDSPQELVGLTLEYQVSLKTGAAMSTVAKLDGAVIEVGYRQPRLEELKGCSVTSPYPGPPDTACALLRADGTSTGLAVQGTVYAPTAAVGAYLENVSNIVFGRGVIARTVDLAMKPMPSYIRPTVIVPDDLDASRTQLFTAYREENGTIRELLRATVKFDPDADTVEVLAWSVLV